MYTSKFKLILHWLLFVVVFYIFWALSYFILARFALSQFNRFNYATGNVLSQITMSDVFWYALFVFGIAVAIFVIRKLIQYAPNRKVAAIVYAILLTASVVVLLDKLLETSTLLNVIPHIVINLTFLVAIVITYFKKDRIIEEEEEQEDVDFSN